MTESPPVLVKDRQLLLDHLDIHEGRTVDADLDPAEVGIKGDTAHVVEGNSYHLGLPEQSRTGYASTESPRDRAGLSKYASALDVGWFEIRTAGKVHNLRTFSVWLVAQCKANTADSRDIREVIYSTDGKVVKRWDRLGKRPTGDSSHLWHTHISLFRDATKAGRGLTVLLTRYLTEIGILEDDMAVPTPAQMVELLEQPGVATVIKRLVVGYKGAPLADDLSYIQAVAEIHAGVKMLLQRPDSDTDEASIVSGILAVLTPQAIVDAIPPNMARQVADEIAARLAS